MGLYPQPFAGGTFCRREIHICFAQLSDRGDGSVSPSAAGHDGGQGIYRPAPQR